jgi:hypothetical protein
LDAALSLTLAGMPPWLAIPLAIGGPVTAAFMLGRLATQLFTDQDFLRNARTGAVKYEFIALIYATAAALALAGSWDIYQTQRDKLQTETSRLYALALTVDAFEGAAFADRRAEMAAAIRGYASAVVTEDWPRMEHGEPSGGSERAFQRLARAFFDNNPETEGQGNLAQNYSGWLGEVAEARIARVSVVSRSLVGLVWLLLLACSVAAIGFQWFFAGSNTRINFAMGSVTAVIVGTVLLVSARLTHPFVGDPPLLSPRPFFALMEVM